MIPWELIGTVVIGLAKWVFSRQAQKKLSAEEFIAHIEAHQKRRQNAGKSAQDFDDVMGKARNKLKEEQDNKNG